MRWQIPGSPDTTSTTESVTIGELLNATDQAPLHKGLAIVAYAEALKTGTSAVLQKAHTTVLEANADGSDAELTEIAELLEGHPAYER